MGIRRRLASARSHLSGRCCRWCSIPFSTSLKFSRRAHFPMTQLRAREYLAMLSGKSAGAYTDAKGVPGIRAEVARFIEARDGHVDLTTSSSPTAPPPSRPSSLRIRGRGDGVLVPLPYPLSASIASVRRYLVSCAPTKTGAGRWT